MISHFQAIIRMISKMKDGIIWIANPNSCFPGVNSGLKESKAKSEMNKIAKMATILGNQKYTFVDVFMIF